jgi:hypothetical protein
LFRVTSGGTKDVVTCPLCRRCRLDERLSVLGEPVVPVGDVGGAVINGGVLDAGVTTEESSGWESGVPSALAGGQGRITGGPAVT